MRKLLNDPFAAVDEMIEGALVALGDGVEITPDGRGMVLRRSAPSRRTGIIFGGGSGHEPAFFGYLGQGLADGAAIGNVFASPSASPSVQIARRIQPDDGVLFVYGNYEGDVMNFGMAGDLLAEEGIRTDTVLVTDDVVSDLQEPGNRRGVAGDVLVLKAAGARADEGADLEQVAAAARHANDRCRSIGVGLGPCIVPTAGRATFQLDEGEMDIGMGVHGEAGVERGTLASADTVADRLVDTLFMDREPRDGESLLVLVNTLGATPVMEAYIVLRRVAQRLRQAGIPLHRALAGEYVTSLEMAGLSLTFAYLDDELRELMDAPSRPLAAPALGPLP